MRTGNAYHMTLYINVLGKPCTKLFVLGTNLVKKAIYAMVEGDCDEVSLHMLFYTFVQTTCSDYCIWTNRKIIVIVGD